MMKNKFVVTVSNLCQEWSDKNKTLYSDVNLLLSPGEKLILEGRSGSGKTTLLRTLAGLQVPTAGRIAWDLNSNPISDIYRLSESERTKIRQKYIGYLDQHSSMISELTIAENIILSLPKNHLLYKNKSKRRERLNELLERLGIDYLEKSFPARCSGGELQRIGLARAVFKNPSLLILDEPTASLDAESAHRVLETLHSCIEKGAALVVSSHDPLVKQWVNSHLILADHVTYEGTR